MKTVVILGIIILITQIEFSQTGSNLRKSFDPFRYLTNQFLSTIQPNATAILYINDTILSQRSFSGGIQDVVLMGLKTYVGYVILLIIAILFIFIFTIFGCCFCCCRVCCKKCGANMKTQGNKSTKNKRIAFNVLLFIFSSMILIGAIVAMASNFIFLETIRGKYNFTDGEGNIIFLIESFYNKFVNYTETLKQNVMVNGRQIIYNVLNDGMVSLRNVTDNFLTTFSSTLSTNELLTSLSGLISTYKSVTNNGPNLSSIASQHNTTTQNFNQYLQNLFNQLNTTLSDDKCLNVSDCGPVRNSLTSLTLGFNTSKITYFADVNTVNVLNGFNVSNLENATNEVNDAISKIKNEINSTITGYMNTIISNFNGSNFMNGLENTINGTVNATISQINTVKSYLDLKIVNNRSINDDVLYVEYVQYWFIGFCILVSIILLIVLLYYLGLCFGICGSPGDYSRCNKGSGSGFFMASVAISFIFGWFIMLIATILFLPGGLMYTEVCTYLNTKDTNRIQVVDNFISPYISPFKSLIPGTTLPDIKIYESLMLRCPSSPDLLTAFNISNAFMNNLTSSIYNQYISRYVNDSISKIENINISVVNTTNLDNNLNNLNGVITILKNSTSQETVTELQRPVIPLDISVFINNIKTLSNNWNSSGKSEAAQNLLNAVLYLEANVSSMKAIHASYASQKAIFNQLVSNLSSNFNDVTKRLTDLKNKPNDARNTAILEAKKKLVDLANTTVNNTVYNVIKAVGNCSTIYDLFMGIYNIACVVVLGPFNNMWMGIGWFLLFTIPAMIFAVKLASLYQISHIETDSAAYNHAYMSSNQFISKNDLEMIKLRRPQKA